MSQAEIRRAKLNDLHLQIYTGEVEWQARHATDPATRGLIRRTVAQLREAADRIEAALGGPLSPAPDDVIQFPIASWGDPQGGDSGEFYQTY